MPGDLIKAMDSVLSTGDVKRSSLERMASQAGLEPEAILAHVNAIKNGFHEVGERIIEDSGIDTAVFETFVQSDPQRRQAMVEAARAMVMSNDTAGLRDLTSSFVEQADKFMPKETRAALDAAGIDWREEQVGLKVLVSGVPVSFAVAVKQRIVNFSRT
jgi:hypothetical protein